MPYTLDKNIKILNKDRISIASQAAPVVKNPPANAGDPGSMPGLGRFPREGIGYPLPVFFGFRGGSDSKESACNAGDLGSIPGLGRSPGRGHGKPL